ncbi:DUF4190 domain-containing protein [Flexivirga aerilata]|uniref:DUF4190 domain-containing protein n=1 Tax=Flexivirga aerilata TaxID=1656889 RepID=UPI001BB186C9|nr:DUF4190 domain-containing protein [Flexivirga aerilata]
MSNYPNDPNQPGGYGEQKPGDQPQYGQSQPGQYGAPQYGAPQGDYPPAGGGYGGGQPAPGGYSGVPQEHKQSTLILILGILSIPCCGLLTGIPAIIMGRNALQQIDASGGAIGGRGKVQAGYICGIVGTVLSIVGIILRFTVLANN